MNVTLLRESFDLIVERSPTVTTRFYEIFFERYPQVRPMFGNTPQARERQEKMLTDALVAVLDHLEDAPWLTETLFALGKRHVGYGVRDEQYAWVGGCLLEALAEAAGPHWNDEVADAWTAAFGAIRDLMLKGAEAARAEAA
jgi:hemoglobin-like flavoprotein